MSLWVGGNLERSISLVQAMQSFIVLTSLPLVGDLERINHLGVESTGDFYSHTCWE